MIHTAAEFEILPADAVIRWEKSVFRGQYLAKHMCKEGQYDVVRWPALLDAMAEMGRLQVPGETSQHAKEVLEK